jgi:hypothetical protein
MGAPDSLVAHRTVTVHCPVRATSARPLGFGAVDRWSSLSFCCTGQSGATPDSPVTSDFCALTLSRHCSTLFICAVDRWRAGSRCSAGSPDSPANYSGECPWNSWEWLVWFRSGLVHQTMSGAHWTVSSAPNFSTLKSFAPIFIVSLIGFLSWFMLNLMHLGYMTSRQTS